MAVYSQATDLSTRQTIWVAQNVVKQRPQLNSHNSDCYNRDQIDGFSSVEVAGMSTSYSGNNWEAKHMEFLKKWEQC
jgi:hypothetical protein